jgi:hypothetical protein
MSSFLLYSTSVFPAGAPTILSISEGNQQVDVNFIPPENTGGQTIINYQYSINEGASWTSVSPESVSTSITITGLTNGVSYSISVRPVYEENIGLNSNIVVAIPKSLPDAPQITSISPGNGQLSINFTAGFDGGSPLTNYEYSVNGGGSWVARSPLSANSPLVVTGLTNGTTYSVRIRAVNAIGSGSQSNQVSATPATVSSAPTITNITGTRIDSTSFTMSIAFTAPSSNGGSAITNYQYSIDGGANWTTRSPSSTSTPISVAVGNLSYNVRIRAVNSMGPGTFSNQITFSSYATGGNEVKDIGIYRYHIFTTSSNFVSQVNRSVEYFVVGSGGAGGINDGGGGGGAAKEPASGYASAGNILGAYFTLISANETLLSQSGGNSSVFGLTALGGGGGGTAVFDADASFFYQPKVGGSGGGGTFSPVSYRPGAGRSGSNTNNGGSSGAFTPHAGSGGGGGATGAGGGGTTTNGGNGGQGLLLTSIDGNLTAANFTSFSGMTHICSGGGGGTFSGGTPGVGGTGGGNGATFSNSATGGFSYGSGGGGAQSGSAGSGKSGIVVIRYIR